MEGRKQGDGGMEKVRKAWWYGGMKAEENRMDCSTS